MSFALFNIVVIGVVYWECPIKKNTMKSSMESDNCYIRHHGTVEAGNLAPTPENLLRHRKQLPCIYNLTISVGTGYSSHSFSLHVEGSGGFLLI